MAKKIPKNDPLATPQVHDVATPTTVTLKWKDADGTPQKAEVTLDPGTRLEDVDLVVAVVGYGQVGNIPTGSIVLRCPADEAKQVTVAAG